MISDGDNGLLWDAENRLIRYTAESGEVTTYGYDYLSRRISKTSDGVTTHYVYDDWNLIAEYIDGALDKTYTWGMDLSG